LYEPLDVGRYRSQPPSPLSAITEIPRTLFEMTTLLASLPLLNMLPKGDKHAVMVLPGFLAGDESTAMLRRYIAGLGYASLPWGLGRNTGHLEIMQRSLQDRLTQVWDEYQGQVSLVGQSLGGVYARELARLFPERVRQVITLGSPFGVTNANAANPMIRRLFERQTGMTIGQMREAIVALDPNRTPPVPLTAIYSKGDGIVNWRVCKETVEDHQTQNIEVCGSHCGMGFNPVIYRIIADRLAQQPATWKKYQA
jgi:pimeloyl-ACP methyl ester carboxylesterase